LFAKNEKMSSEVAHLQRKFADIERSFLVVVQQLQIMLETRISKHNNHRDKTRTIDHINETCNLLAHIMHCEEGREAAELFLQTMHSFDINRVFRPTSSCKQDEYEYDRALVLRMYHQAHTLARAIVKREDMPCEPDLGAE